MGETLDLLFLCALRIDKKGLDWNLLAREIGRTGSPSLLLRGQVVETSKRARESLQVLRAALADRGAVESARARVDRELEAAEGVDARLVTVLDDNYPRNLRLIHDRPPFLFIRGSIIEEDSRAVAVVGTRDATELGLKRARQMTAQLVGSGVTVVSGLASGIDTAAHTTALSTGGRTIAVLGTGITKCYPPENEALAERIATGSSGALVSQFWPTTGSSRYTFPRRNVVTSGMSQGTVVIEASPTSGAKMQARLALQHGKRVWLIHSLVTSQPWAKTYVAERGAIEITDTRQVVAELKATDTIRSASVQSAQLSLDAL